MPSRSNIRFFCARKRGTDWKRCSEAAMKPSRNVTGSARAGTGSIAPKSQAAQTRLHIFIRQDPTVDGFGNESRISREAPNRTEAPLAAQRLLRPDPGAQ